MLPKLFGIFDSYTVMLVLGILASFVLAIIYIKYKKYTKKDILDLIICGAFAIVGGIVFALGFQTLYDLIEDPSNFTFTFKMTFYGGLFGGVLFFVLTYYLLLKKKTTLDLGSVLNIAPACITLAHGIGRIGCFLAPCCYGIEHEHGLYFAELGTKVIPTQLYEMIFLLVLSSILIVMAFKDFKYSYAIYLGTYSIFRFIIEFFRGDDRGFTFLGMSPSQLWSILILISLIPLILLVNKYVYIKKETK
jgi:phosphatidylglycerol:prolipoprotein diacylglycerol transferase